ncbi:exocyst complex component 3 [Chrysoperla carnea]|uniref:exocyst complex component 3 n=1 Tax=Chrysoperla carnea TaxID=189513 RepID=UPI001D091BE8|nr:exocyst complex component 3 [Chrysoperla carnea]
MKTEMNIEKKEAEAKAMAVKHVINMLQRQGQLEKVEQYKRRVSNKKASIEALLKTAMQSQLDGVRVGLNQLNTCLNEIQEIRTSMKSMGELVSDVRTICNKLQDVRDENMRHSQYTTAMNNLKHIFTLPESVKKTEQWIHEGKLLHAHQLLSDLENSRNDLLLELHKLPNQSLHDIVTLKTYFKEVDVSSKLLETEIRLILGRTLNTVRKEPTALVTVLRIVEREQKYDQEAIKMQKQTGFLPPGRPKKWKDMVFEVLEKTVATRIEGTQTDGREDNKLWLVKYLELIRMLIVEDLRVVKTLCLPCFPPHYDIFNRYVKMYHECLSTHLQEIIQNGIEGNEYVSLLSWVLNTYPGDALMQHPELGIDLDELGPLLPVSLVNSLQTQTLKNMESNYIEWMHNTIVSEKQEWQTVTPPEEVGTNGYFRSVAPVIIFQMIDQNLQVTKTISQELTDRALVLSVDQVLKYGESYRECIVEFKNKHFEDRSQIPYFTHHMITIVNNCLQLIELSTQLKQQYWTPRVNDAAAGKFEAVFSLFLNLRNESGMFLLDEAFLDLDKHFDELFTTKWLTTRSIAIDTICVTLEDYFQDYCYLCEENFEYVLTEAENLVARRYVTAMLSKKLSFKTTEDRNIGVNKIISELNQLKSFFTRIAPNMPSKNQQLDVIAMLSEVLKCEDIDMISLDLQNLVDQYPDITEDLLYRLLYLRGDISRSVLSDKVSFAVSNRKFKQTTSKSVFKNIHF